MPQFKGSAEINLLLLFFCSHIQSLVELESVIVATAPYFERTAPLTYSLWLKPFQYPKKDNFFLTAKLFIHKKDIFSDESEPS